MKINLNKIKNVYIGAFISGSTAVIIYLLNVISNINFDNTQYTYLAATFIPVLIYTINKYSNGSITIKKVAKSFCLALTGVIIAYLGGSHFTPEIDSLLLFISPTLLNAIIEYFKKENIQ